MIPLLGLPAGLYGVGTLWIRTEALQWKTIAVLKSQVDQVTAKNHMNHLFKLKTMAIKTSFHTNQRK